jgi:hypothetical protein
VSTTAPASAPRTATAPIGSTAKALWPPTSRLSAFRLRGSIRPPGSIAASARIQPNLHRFYGAGEASIVQVVATSYRARISTARTCSKAASPRRHRQVECKEVIVGSPGGPSRRRTLLPRGATQSRSFDRRHRGRLRPPVRDRSCRRRAAPNDWQRQGVVPIHRSGPRLHREIPSGPRVATAVRRADSVPAPARCPPGISRSNQRQAQAAKTI